MNLKSFWTNRTVMYAAIWGYLLHESVRQSSWWFIGLAALGVVFNVWLNTVAASKKS
jgi:hypothetical protein